MLRPPGRALDGVSVTLVAYAALPPHSAERLRLSGGPLFDFEATPQTRFLASFVYYSTTTSVSLLKKSLLDCRGCTSYPETLPVTF